MPRTLWQLPGATRRRGAALQSPTLAISLQPDCTMRKMLAASRRPSAPSPIAVVRLTGRVEVPVVGGVLESVGGSVTVTVEARDRATLP